MIHKNNVSLILLIFSMFCIQCESESNLKQENTHSTKVDKREDIHSFAQPDQAKTKHLSLNLEADFDKKILKGNARWQIENNKATQIIFDAKGLKIEKITLGREEEETTYTLTEAQEFLGSALIVDIKPSTSIVTIFYETTPEGGAALDWTKPQQTAGKKHPALFTQGQAILTRTWIPCQDSPGIRITYNATIKVPTDLLALMSATNPQEKNAEGIYSFKMKQPIPTYLLALAIGDFVFKPIDARTGVYAEPSVIDKAVYEFEDMGKMLDAAEKLYGNYMWERYDVIVLPPSFPFGGMENPRLTFATPTIIAGDQSLVSLIAHELAHSWSGNLVTNATWDDFWLNEGFTVYFERRIMEALYGKDYVDMLALLGQQDLESTIDDLGKKSKDTHLHLHLEGRDPDDGMTDIAYEKGAAFLTLLEHEVGRDSFDIFLNRYFETHRFQTITTEKFVEYLTKNLLKPQNVNIDIKEWIYQPGIPANLIKIKSDKFALVEADIEKIVTGAKSNTLDTKNWTTHEWLHFIRHLPQDLDKEKMSDLDKTFSFSQSGNSEILAAWFELSIYNGYSTVNLAQIENFLVHVGRRKFLSPLYKAFKNTKQLDTAKAIYAKAKPNYHTVSTQTLDQLLFDTK